MTEEFDKEMSPADEYVQQGQVLIGTEKFLESIVYFDKALNEDPMNQTAYISKGVAKASLDQLDDAKECFSRAIMIKKDNPDPYVHLGNMFFLQDKFEEGLKNYNQAISLGYNDADLYYHLGVQYEERNELDLAIRNYTKATHIDSMNPVYRIRKASVQLLLQQHHEALQTLEDLLKISPDSFDGYHLSAAAYTMLGDYEKADEVLAFAESLFPDDKDIIFDRIRVLVTKGDLDLAIDKLNQMDKVAENSIDKKEIRLNLGKIVGQKDDLDSAIQYFKEGLNFEEEESIDLELRYLLMNSYLVKNNYQGILEQAEELEKFGSDNVYSLCGKYYKSFALTNLNSSDGEKSYRDAIRFYRSVSTSDPSRIDAYLFRAMCHKDLSEFDKAIEMIDYVALIQPENGQFHVIKGNVLKEMGKIAEAEAEYQIAKGMQGTFVPGI